jgi:predicted dehydrogenase
MTVRYGVVGCGRQAPKHISGLVARGGVDIVVADIDAARAAALGAAQGVAVAASVDALFADPDVVAVSICTPPATHGELLRGAIAAGKHFLCEKPLTATLAEARALEAAAAAAELVAMVGYIYRFAPAFELAARALEGAALTGTAAALGRLSHATFRLGGPGSHGAWQHRSETEGGAINEMLVHMVDLALWYFGPVASAEMVASDVRQPARTIAGQHVEADVEDWVLARLRTETGVDVLIQADLSTPIFLQFAEIHGDNGSFFGSIQSEMPTFIHCDGERAGFAPGRTPYQFGPRNLFEAEMALFLDCVTEGRKPDRCTLADSVRLMETIEALRSGAA